MISEIEKLISDNHIKNKGEVGLRPVDIANKLGKPYSEVKPFLYRLLNEGKIYVRSGINSKLIYYVDKM